MTNTNKTEKTSKIERVAFMAKYNYTLNGKKIGSTKKVLATNIRQVKRQMKRFIAKYNNSQEDESKVRNDLTFKAIDMVA